MIMIIMLDYRTPEQKAEAKARAAAQSAKAVNGGDAATATAAVAVDDAPAAAATATSAVFAPIAGHVVSLDDAGDPVFASRALGEGVGIEPVDGAVKAPVSGVLQTVAETGHAFGLKTDDGIEVLVHVGIDTVKMNGNGFVVNVAKGDRVNAGDLLATVDLGEVKKAGFSTTTLVTVLNTAALKSVTPKTDVNVAAGDEVIAIEQ